MVSTSAFYQPFCLNDDDDFSYSVSRTTRSFELETVGTSSLYLFQTRRPSRWAPDDMIVLGSGCYIYIPNRYSDKYICHTLVLVNFAVGFPRQYNHLRLIYI